MDFFDREARARKQTRRLLWLFGLTVIAALAVNNFLLCPLIACFTHPVLPSGGRRGIRSIFFATAVYLFGEALVHPAHFCELVFHWQPILWVSLGTLISIFAGSYYKIRELSDGGAVRGAISGRTPRRRQAGRFG